VTVKDRERTYASNLLTSYRALLGPPSGFHESTSEEGVQGLHAYGGASEEFSAAYWVYAGPLTEGVAYEGTTSVQLEPWTPKTLLDESGHVTIFMPALHVPTGPWSFGSESGSASWTGDVGATILPGASPRSTYGFGDLLTRVFSYLMGTTEADEPQAVEQPHQKAVGWIKEATGLSWERVGRLVGVSRQAVNAWRRGAPIADDHRRKLLEVRNVLERAAKRNPRSVGLAAWLDTPRGADARTPADLLEAGEVGKARLLALASPSSGVKAPPEWARRSAREAYLNSRERVRALAPERDEQLLDEDSEDEDE
jgi:DNA-binding transcriptional regulator YiaG